MKKLVATMPVPGRLTVLAALMAGLSAPAMAVSPDLVISQVYGAGGNAGTTFFTHDYIEIFNRGTTAVTAEGWSVQYGSATSTGAWSGKSALPTFTVEPGQYVLIQEQSGGAGQPSLPNPLIVPASGFNMSASNGKVALVRDSVTLSGATPAGDNVADLIGFGTANGAEGTRAPAMSAALALFRANGGCGDTDDNSMDFATGAPAPRTSASPRNSCGNTIPQAKPIIPVCPASMAIEQGKPGAVPLSASDEDSIVNGAVIASGNVPGISLGSLSPASANGGSASVNLQASAALASGSYPVVIRFTNNAGQEATCPVSVSVAGAATIPQIQGAGAASPFVNASVSTEGVVTHKVSNGYFIQDANGDGDPATSDGLFVFTGTAPLVAVGDLVRVKGTIVEYKPTGAARTYTEMKDVTATSVLGAGHSVTPANIVFEPGMDLARHEAMLVNITNALTVNQTSYLGDRGELTLSVGRRETATNRYRPGTPEALALAKANAGNQLVLDDSWFVAPPAATPPCADVVACSGIPYLGQDGTVRAGDTVGNLVGVVDFGAIGGGGTAFKIQPTAAPSFTRSNPRLLAPELPVGNIKVASANVLNFFTTFLDGTDAWGRTGQGCTVGSTTRASNCRGADNSAEFVRQRDKIVRELKGIDADVVGLMEIQNNDDIAVDYLVKQLNAAIGYPAYAYVPKPATTGTDAIRVAMIYKPAKLAMLGGALSDGDAVNNRPPMAQTFKAGNGATFSLIVNHLKSKGGCGSGANADLGDGQSCNNATRVLQATRLATYFIPHVISSAGDPDVLVIGDMNAHGFEDPIHVLNQAGLVNELERFVRPSGIPYSYVFDGESGYLDHALASASLDAQVAGATEWHTNADEPTVIDYNTDAKSAAAAALYRNDAFRSSDHDPVVVALNLAPTYLDVTTAFREQRSGLSVDRLANKFSATITLTNTSGAAITGPVHLVLSGLTEGVILENKSGVVGNEPYVSVNNATIQAGEKITLRVVFSNPARRGIGFVSKILSGSL
ncbi:ExeM/NucH family extracellular endonuclease [Massilia sp. CCM 8695]|uniref:ExeM/NucH family extracellular endonuclease n=1 Tax=Massilia frigida TaxID=2609281 RepID=A0ABX0N2B2_9BURK|nr:ExeM/NucH family extracellular endonuclease [Massilia frigida]NHZ78568.1 ExeM/NucH family extracellular endonuclease [Massilia frigida]